MNDILTAFENLSISDRTACIKQIQKMAKNKENPSPTTSKEFQSNYNTDSPDKLQNFKTLLVTNNLETKSHQLHGINWLLSREEVNHVRGGILADEMGLGKTFQVLGCIICNIKPKTLIVLPPPLIDQWVNIFTKYTKILPLIYHPSIKNAMDQDISELDAAIVITSYGMMAKMKTEIMETKWDRVIFDEAHHLRNSKTSSHLGVKRLQVDIIWCITGTPIQNKLADIQALLLLMGYEKHEVKGDNLANLLKIALLKRTKQSTELNLPTLNEHSINIDWQENYEKKLAEKAHQYAFSVPENDPIFNKKDRMIYMLRAKQSCINTQLLPECADFNEEEISTKIAQVYETIKKTGFSKPKLVFCQFRGEIDMIHKCFEDHKDLKISIFDGRQPLSSRKEMIKSHIDILLIQIQCGCEGLNLQQFKEVYFTSPHWNPAIEQQAIARCHRIGQTEEINVYRFYMKSFISNHDLSSETESIDSYIKRIQDNKKQHFI